MPLEQQQGFFVFWRQRSTVDRVSATALGKAHSSHPQPTTPFFRATAGHAKPKLALTAALGYCTLLVDLLSTLLLRNYYTSLQHKTHLPTHGPRLTHLELFVFALLPPLLLLRLPNYLPSTFAPYPSELKSTTISLLSTSPSPRLCVIRDNESIKQDKTGQDNQLLTATITFHNQPRNRSVKASTHSRISLQLLALSNRQYSKASPSEDKARRRASSSTSYSTNPSQTTHDFQTPVRDCLKIDSSS